MVTTDARASPVHLPSVVVSRSNLWIVTSTHVPDVDRRAELKNYKGAQSNQDLGDKKVNGIVVNGKEGITGKQQSVHTVVSKYAGCADKSCFHLRISGSRIAVDIPRSSLSKCVRRHVQTLGRRCTFNLIIARHEKTDCLIRVHDDALKRHAVTAIRSVSQAVARERFCPGPGERAKLAQGIHSVFVWTRYHNHRSNRE